MTSIWAIKRSWQSFFGRLVAPHKKIDRFFLISLRVDVFKSLAIQMGYAFLTMDIQILPLRNYLNPPPPRNVSKTPFTLGGMTGCRIRVNKVNEVYNSLACPLRNHVFFLQDGALLVTISGFIPSFSAFTTIGPIGFAGVLTYLITRVPGPFLYSSWQS